MKLLLLDHLDSFTYNIADLFERLGVVVEVRETIIPDMTHLVLGPGPGSPRPQTIALLKQYAGQLPILGICLGHQTIAAAFGGKVTRAEEPRHGKVETIVHDGEGLFAGVKNPLAVTRYHSLIVQDLPACLIASAHTETGEIMAIRHREYPIMGVQFHPEGVASEEGRALCQNFLETGWMGNGPTKGCPYRKK